MSTSFKFAGYLCSANLQVVGFLQLQRKGVDNKLVSHSYYKFLLQLGFSVDFFCISALPYAAEVVKYSGSLHDRSYPWMREDAETADLCLVLGTSLGGLNADQERGPNWVGSMLV